MCFLGRRELINQTSFVDVSVVEISATIRSRTSIPLLESSTTTLTPTSETVSEAEDSPDSSVPTNPPSMFSTSMAPPRPTPAGQEEELITTVAPTIKEEHEDTDDVTDVPDLNIDDFVSENVTNTKFVPHRGDTFPEPKSTTESTDTSESVSKPIEESDDHSIIVIKTIQPDVPIPDTSLITEPMFAKGKTEETIPESGIATTIYPTESIELTSEEVFSSSESTPSPTGLHSTTPFPDYEEIATDFALEGLPPTPPSQQDLSSSPSDSTGITDRTTTPTAIPTDTTFMCNTQPGSEVEITSTGPAETTSSATQITPQMQDVETPAVVYKEQTTAAAAIATAILTDSGTSAEDVTSSTSVHIFDESTTEFPEHSGDALTEDGTEIGTEFFTSPPMASAKADRTTTSSTVVTDEQSIQVTTVTQMQSVSGKTYKPYLKPLKLHLTSLSIIQIWLCM